MRFAMAFCITCLITACGGGEDKPKDLGSDNSKSPLEQKVASIDAGTWIEMSDSSVQRIKRLLLETESVYGTPKEKIADMAARARQLAKAKNISVSIAELLESAPIICDVKCTDQQFSENTAQYIISRAGATHHQAIHGLVILQNFEKRLSQ